MKSLLRPFLVAIAFMVMLGLWAAFTQHRQLKKSSFVVVIHQGPIQQRHIIEPPISGHYEMHIIRSMSPRRTNQWQQVYPDTGYQTNEFNAFGKRGEFPLYLYFDEKGSQPDQLRGVRLPEEFGPVDAMLDQPVRLDKGSLYSIFVYDLEKKRYSGNTAFKLQDCGVFFGTHVKNVQEN